MMYTVYTRRGENADGFYARLLNGLTGQPDPDPRRPQDPAHPESLTALTVLIKVRWNDPQLPQLQSRAYQVIRPLLR